ncbi:uncharacterized protein [Periplaneta americana]|uniref:uncharacterized protein isoform X2 n=1 Tax=Periplaneta americana TaxID=6978 RepID=UPI0037E78598
MDVIKTYKTEPLGLKNEGTVLADIKAEQDFDHLSLEKEPTICTDMIKLEPEIDPLASTNDGTFPTDIIKTENEVNSLMSKNDDTNTGGRRSLSVAGNFLKVNVNEIKLEPSDLSDDPESNIKFEENEVPVYFPVLKYEIEEEPSVTDEEPMPVVMERNDNLTQMC